LNHKNPYVIYLDNLISLAYEKSANRQTTYVVSTFNGSVINNSLLLLNNLLLTNKIPSASLIVFKNNEIIAGYSYSLEMEKQNRLFENFYPKVKPYSSLKPFNYLAMVNNNLTIPTLLLESKYQNLMFTSKSGQKNILNNTNSTVNYSVLDAITNTNLDVIPKELRDLFAKQLISLEYDLFTNVDLETYMKSFNILFNDNNPYTSEDIAKNNFETSLLDLTRAYNALTNRGNIFNLRYLTFINDTPYAFDTRVQKQINTEFAEVLEAVYFKKINSGGNDYFYIIDFNTAFVYSPSTGYTVGLWLGDLSNQDKVNNYSKYLEDTIKSFIRSLP
jgi:hypothetical protein